MFGVFWGRGMQKTEEWYPVSLQPTTIVCLFWDCLSVPPPFFLSSTVRQQSPPYDPHPAFQQTVWALCVRVPHHSETASPIGALLKRERRKDGPLLSTMHTAPSVLSPASEIFSPFRRHHIGLVCLHFSSSTLITAIKITTQKKKTSVALDWVNIGQRKCK